ncbi:MAG: hypothetical protein QNJ81_06810 [Acidimicrobiia bacterium]|nr:hypothetical protein [Acidimicrobiia bacterium]
MLTHAFFDSISDRIPAVGFTMIFSDGEHLTGCMYSDGPDPYNATDKEIIDSCNKSNPERWGKVVAITDKVKTWCWRGKRK